MSIYIKKFVIVTLAIIVSIGSLGFNANALTTQEEWDARFPSTEPLLSNTVANDTTAEFSWHGHYWLRSYVSMAKAFGDTKYIEKAQRLIDHMFYYRDDARAARGEINTQSQPYHDAPAHYLLNRGQAAPGWRWIQSVGPRVLPLTDGMICNAIMRYVDLVMSDNRFTAYRVKAQSYIPKVEETVNSHNSSFVYNRFDGIPGSYYYVNPDGSGLYSGANEFNMSAIMGGAMLLLDKVKGSPSEYSNKAAAILDYWKTNVTLQSNGTYTWLYHPQKPSIIGVEDINHGHYDINFLILCYQSGLDISLQDMQRLTKTFTDNVYLGSGLTSKKVDGSEVNTDYHWAAGFDWIDLSQFDPMVLSIAKEVYNRYFQSSAWSRPLLGWAEILRWSLPQQPDEATPPPAPKNLRII